MDYSSRQKLWIRGFRKDLREGSGGMLYTVQAVFYANDHPALNEPCDTLLSCILGIRLGSSSLDILYTGAFPHRIVDTPACIRFGF